MTYFRTMHHRKMLSENKRFFLYSLYAWGLSLFLTIIAYVVDNSESLPEHLQPGIGVTTCFMRSMLILLALFFNYHKWFLILFSFEFTEERLSEFLFFLLPMFIIITLNIIFFILTALKIRQTQQELQKITSKEESSRHRKNLNSDKDKYVV